MSSFIDKEYLGFDSLSSLNEKRLDDQSPALRILEHIFSTWKTSPRR